MIVVYVGFEIRLKILLEIEIENQYNFTFFSKLNHDTVCTNIENGGRHEAASFILTL